MINLLALSLLAASLAAAGVWSPPPQPPEPPVAKEGQPGVIFTPRLDREDVQDINSPLHEVEEKLKEALSILPNVGQGLSYSGGDDQDQEIRPSDDSNKGRICDAYGKCKETVHSTIGNVKEKASEMGEKVNQIGKEAIKDGKDIEERAKEKVYTAYESMKDSAHATSEKVRLVGETGYNKVKSAKDIAIDKAKSFREDMHTESMILKNKVADGVKETQDTAKTLRGDVVGNITRVTKATTKSLSTMRERVMTLAKGAWGWMWSFRSLKTGAGIVHLLSFSATYGTCMWVTFLSSYLLAGSLNRQQFGLVQSKIYPVYFRLNAYGIGFALFSHILMKKHFRMALPDYSLLVSLGLVLVNLFYLEPRANKVMFERLKLEKEEGKGRDVADILQDQPAAIAAAATAKKKAEIEALKSKMGKLNGRLKSLNTYSSFCNVLSLMGLTWHLVYLAQRLQISY